MAETTPALERGLAQLGRRFTDIARILVTHVHRDHYSYAVALRQRWGTHIALGCGESDTLQTVMRMADGGPRNSSVTRLRAAGAPELADIIASAPRPDGGLGYFDLPDEWLAGGQAIALKDRTVEAIATPGHTRGHLVFTDGTARSMFSGDHLLPHITPSIGFEAAPSASPLGSYLQSLARTLQLPDLQLLPAHGPTGPSTHERAEELLAHHARRLDLSAAAVAAGAQTGLEVAQQLRWTRRERKLADLDPFNQMLAVLETVAHLTVLVAQDRVRQTVADQVDRYSA